MSLPKVSVKPSMHCIWVTLRFSSIPPVCSDGETPNTRILGGRVQTLPSVCAFSGWGLLSFQVLIKPSAPPTLPNSPWAGGVMGDGSGWVTHSTLYLALTVLEDSKVTSSHCITVPSQIWQGQKWQQEQSLAVRASRQQGSTRKHIYWDTNQNCPSEQKKPTLRGQFLRSVMETQSFGLENSPSGHCALGISGRQLWYFYLTLFHLQLSLYLQLTTSHLLWFPTEF